MSDALDSLKSGEFAADAAARLEKEFSRLHSVAVSDSRHRCALCRKLFLAAGFVEKHLALRHSEELRGFLREKLSAAFFANYERDRNHFELSSVESVIPGDVTGEMVPRDFFYFWSFLVPCGLFLGAFVCFLCFLWSFVVFRNYMKMRQKVR